MMPTTLKAEFIIWSPFFRCDVETIQTYVPQKSGVYILYSGQTALYVGQALDLQQQLFEHRSVDEPNEGIKDRIENCRVVFGTAQPDRIAGIQKHVFDTLHPCCNLVDPGGAPIPVHYLPTPGQPSMN